jgi:hypothetical protein
LIGIIGLTILHLIHRLLGFDLEFLLIFDLLLDNRSDFGCIGFFLIISRSRLLGAQLGASSISCVGLLVNGLFRGLAADLVPVLAGYRFSNRFVISHIRLGLLFLWWH